MDKFQNADLLLISNIRQSAESVMARRNFASEISDQITTIKVENLQTQINFFLNQMDTVLTSTPEKVGDFNLSEIEVSAAIVAQAKGKIGIALLGQGEISGQITGGLKFVFKRE